MGPIDLSYEESVEGGSASGTVQLGPIATADWSKLYEVLKEKLPV
jgi:hypothetical protein